MSYLQKCISTTFGVVVTTFLGQSLNSSVIHCEPSRSIVEDNNDESEESFFTATYKNVSGWLSGGDQGVVDDLNKSESRVITQLQLKEKYDAPKYPIVLCHGLSGFDKLMLIPSIRYIMELYSKKDSVRRDFVVADHDGIALEYWFGIKEALEEKGSTVMVARVPGFGSIDDRANHLNRFITREVDYLRTKSVNDIYNEDKSGEKTFEQKNKRMKVNLIAHSMGGLDARYLITELEKSNYEVVSLTTVTTPHRGSEVADFVVSIANQLPSSIKLPPSLYQLTTEYMREFNKSCPNDPKVQYFSYGASFKPSWYNVFYYSWSIINSRVGENDGMVSVNSAKWGKYMGTIQNVDHLDLINWTNGFKRVANKVVPSSDPPPINSVALYLGIADNLAKRGL